MKTSVPPFTPFRNETIMFKFLSWLSAAAASLFLACLCTAPADAASQVTFVSGKGTDTGTCASPLSACRTFQFAISQTAPFGEVKALDPAEYGPMTITQSVSITGVEGASVNRISGDEITISAGTSDVVNLSHLILDGLQGASLGIVLNSSGSLTITHCTVRNFRAAGIKLQPTSPLSFLVADTLVSDNGANGINIIPATTGSAKGGLNRVWLYHNGGGLAVTGAAGSGGSNVVAVESLAINNNATGFSAGPNGVLRLSRSAAFGNGTGVSVASGVTAESAGTNFIRGNGTDISGTLTNVGTL
jgi:Right handed beta helix region